MTARRQWTLIAGVLTVAGFSLALAIKIHPEIALVGVGSTAPAFHAIDPFSGKAATLADYRGKVVLVNIWATWCEPCKAEMPALERLHHVIPDTSFRILAVSVDQDPPRVVTDFTRAMGLTFTILQDPSREIQDSYQTTGVPESFVIDKDGRIVKKVIGAAQWDGPVNVNLVRSLLNER